MMQNKKIGAMGETMFSFSANGTNHWMSLSSKKSR